MDRILKAARSSGSLNLSNRSLREIPAEVYRNLDAVGEGEKWWEAVELQKLILAHNNIEVLKDDLKNLSLLAVLNISHNKLSHLPTAIGELTMLKSLDVSFNLMGSIPEEIGSATSLVKLDCSHNQLKELPSSLGRCSDLSDLKASHNSIARLPEDLSNCSKLIKLDLEGNKLTMLSENMIASWTMLTELNAAKNLLESIPDNMGILSQLIRLDLHQNLVVPPVPMAQLPDVLVTYVRIYRNNRLSSLQPGIGALSRLGTLDLHSNQLKEYPVEACKLRLSVLDLSNNSLSGLPAEIGQVYVIFTCWDEHFNHVLGTMTTLRKLLLTGNPLRTLRSSLVNGPTATLLKHLQSRVSADEVSGSATTAMNDDQIAMASRLSISSKELSLGGLGLSSIPPVVWESNDVVKVDLSRNSIEVLPDELSSCSSLQTLLLSGNKIKEWPGAVFASLLNLSCLKLDKNPLAQIPLDGFRSLSKVQVLDLSYNASSLPDPSALSSMPELQELYLRRMQLREVPLDLLSLPKLRILDLSQNSLVSIPKEFKNLISLTELDLSDNNIATLPPELGLLEPSLQVLRLAGNPLRSIRRAILDRGTKAVLNYLKDKLPEQ
ncbi:plant intracellular Ras-group-related LRR protein 6-like isoform X1 [Tasmannia lanceolata]|uniref:plant intracellular Ras-group-related LRR protein 6-like isoform X1 n=1 Tax=Tasmannia lanceolata TaxID=3420 RepID=UPI0040635892